MYVLTINNDIYYTETLAGARRCLLLHICQEVFSSLPSEAPVVFNVTGHIKRAVFRSVADDEWLKSEVIDWL